MISSIADRQWVSAVIRRKLKRTLRDCIVLRGALESINVSACENLHYQEEKDVLTDVEIFPIWLTNRRFSVSLQIFSEIQLHDNHSEWCKKSGIPQSCVLVSVLWVRMLAGVTATEISQLCCKYPPPPPPALLLPSHLPVITHHCLTTGYLANTRLQTWMGLVGLTSTPS